MLNWPAVKVPVLSSAMVSMVVSCSRASARLSKTPCLFNRAIAQVRAEGVANPSAQGQVATSTAIAIQNASSLPCQYQNANVAAEITSTAETK